MKTPEAYKKNLEQNIITIEMLDYALWSANKRAKNWRDKKREYRFYFDDSYHNFEKAEAQEQKYYAAKDKLLSLLSPVCIHQEFGGYRRTRVYDYTKGYEDRLVEHLLQNEVVWTNSYFDYESGCKVKFFDYVDRGDPIYRYYLFYQLPDHSYHTPIADVEVRAYCDKYHIEVKPISTLQTEGQDIANLASAQFVGKMLALIESGKFQFENSYQPVDHSTEESPAYGNASDVETDFSLFHWWPFLWKYMEKKGMLCGDTQAFPDALTDAECQTTEESAKRFMEKSWQKYEREAAKKRKKNWEVAPFYVNPFPVTKPKLSVPELTIEFTNSFLDQFPERLSIDILAAMAREHYHDIIAAYQHDDGVWAQKQNFVNDHWDTWLAEFQEKQTEKSVGFTENT